MWIALFETDKFSITLLMQLVSILAAPFIWMLQFRDHPLSRTSLLDCAIRLQHASIFACADGIKGITIPFLFSQRNILVLLVLFLYHCMFKRPNKKFIQYQQYQRQAEQCQYQVMVAKSNHISSEEMMVHYQSHYAQLLTLYRSTLTSLRTVGFTEIRMVEAGSKSRSVTYTNFNLKMNELKHAFPGSKLKRKQLKQLCFPITGQDGNECVKLILAYCTLCVSIIVQPLSVWGGHCEVLLYALEWFRISNIPFEQRGEILPFLNDEVPEIETGAFFLTNVASDPGYLIEYLKRMSPNSGCPQCKIALGE
jgi:hypothetical protein